MKKLIFAALLIIFITFTETASANACPYTPECMATSKTIACGTRYGEFYHTHDYTAANGYVYSCGITNERAQHSIFCSGCHASYGTQLRTCNERHSTCGHSRYNLCQYQ